MPRRRVHSGIGLVTGIGAGFLATQGVDPDYRVLEVAAAAIGGLLGGIAPDVLEPAGHPNHRAFFHSVTSAGVLSVAAGEGWVALLRDQADECAARAAAALQGSDIRHSEEFKCAMWHCLAGVLIGFFAGYASHLILDAGTSKGLPVL